MSGKKLMIMVVALGVVSFAGTFVMTQMFQPAVNFAMSPEKLSQEEKEKTTLAGIEAMNIGDNVQLDNLMQEVERERDQLTLRERDMDDREQRIQMALEQLQEKTRELESMRLQLAGPLVKLKGLKRDLEQTRLKIAMEEELNLKNNAKTIEQMDPEAGSKLIEEMCDVEKGQIDDAAKYLHYMSDRGKAKLLSNITNPDVTVELLKRMKTIQQEEG